METTLDECPGPTWLLGSRPCPCAERDDESWACPCAVAVLAKLRLVIEDIAGDQTKMRRVVSIRVWRGVEGADSTSATLERHHFSLSFLTPLPKRAAPGGARRMRGIRAVGGRAVCLFACLLVGAVVNDRALFRSVFSPRRCAFGGLAAVECWDTAGVLGSCMDRWYSQCGRDTAK